MKNITDEIASTFLGKKVSGSATYDPTLLVKVPRFENRKQYEISNNNLPFTGWDVWHAYEFSVMTENGLPITRVLKLKYNCNNEYLVESKSLKLYLNSFNMTRFGNNISECLEICKHKIEHDLSKTLETSVEIEFLDDTSETISIYQNFQNILNTIEIKDLVIDKFKEAPEVLEIKEEKFHREYFLKFDSLRSNCRVTHQPDFGDAFIYYKSKKHITESTLVKYLSSFLSEYHFHEECCEMIFKRLSDILDKDDDLFISILYTRRGGIDICPSRWKGDFPNDVFELLNLKKFARNGVKQ